MTKLTYEQMRGLADLGAADPQKLTIKNKAGHVTRHPCQAVGEWPDGSRMHLGCYKWWSTRTEASRYTEERQNV